MSRWIESFENHPFQTVWRKIVDLSEEVISDDSTIVTSVEEIARFKKIVTFIDELLNSCDPELIPESTWSNFSTQSTTCLQHINNYQNTRNIEYIKNANGNLDNLITYIRPYQVIASNAARSASASFVSYTKVINSNLTSFQEEVKSIISEIESHKVKISESLEETESLNSRIKELEENYFDDTNTESLSTKIENFEVRVEDSYEKITALVAKVFEGDDDEKSIEESLHSALDDAESDKKSIASLLSDLKINISDFMKYYSYVFGEKNEEGEFEGGLKNELIARQKSLNDFKEQQEIRYRTLNSEIEGLLPGATTAGLATAYHDLKKSFDSPIQVYSKLFYGSIAFLVLVAFISITQNVGWFYINFVEISDLTKLASNILYKLPIILPVIWLTIFASKRRSEALRLQQEYSHKEALAKSYQNFKVQIEALNDSDPQLMKKLLNAAIDAVSMNASDTLDGKHGDKLPSDQGIDGIISSVEKLKRLLS